MTKLVQRLSPIMKQALIAIDHQGGLAKPKGGGWWLGADDVMLEVNACDGCPETTVGTPTIYGLEKRGLLMRRYEQDRPHKDIYAITRAGADAVTEFLP